MSFPTSARLNPALLLTFLCLSLPPSLQAGEITNNALPPAAAGQIHFTRDILPILSENCFRCHGPQRQKSDFRLDQREAALRGGNNNTNDLVPGDSFSSLLVHYVAREVPEMEMPPVDMGKPLTARQISLLRAWIDQGATWESTDGAAPPEGYVKLALREFSVAGNQNKFREIEGIKEGAGGGVEEFACDQKVGSDETLALRGRFLMPDRDLRLKLEWDRQNYGFIHAGFEQWRKYYDDTGGFAPGLPASQFNFNRDLFLDNGRVWVDLGLTLPDWPRIVLGYEYRIKNGDKSTLDWGGVGALNQNLAPALKSIDERTHIIKLDVSHDLAGWHLEDSARLEFYRQKTRDEQSNAFQSTGGTTRTQDRYDHVQGMNTLTIEKQILDWWYLSGGGYYSRLEGGDFFNQDNGAFGLSWASDRITLKRESEIFSLASLFTPLDRLNLSLGTQNEWTHEEAFGNAPDMEFFIPSAPESASRDQFKARQSADVRFTKIPCTVLFAGGRFEESSLDDVQLAAPAGALTHHTDSTDQRYDLRAGFNTSPWRWLALTAQYQRRFSDTDYNQLRDVWGSGLGAPTNGYPGFILGRSIALDKLDTKLDLHPAQWLKTTLTWQISDTDYSTQTDPAVDAFSLQPVSPGGIILAGRERAQTYGLGATLTPFRRFYLSSTFTFGLSRLSTPGHGISTVLPYRGNTYTLINTATYALNAKTDLQAAYNFSRSDYRQDNSFSGMTGMEFTHHQLSVGLVRRVTERLTVSARYSFYRYTEPGAGRLTDYTAHGVFAFLTYRWP